MKFTAPHLRQFVIDSKNGVKYLGVVYEDFALLFLNDFRALYICPRSSFYEKHAWGGGGGGGEIFRGKLLASRNYLPPQKQLAMYLTHRFA